MSTERKRRLAENEALARDVNEVVDDVAATWFDADERLEFRCECALPSCAAHVSLDKREYESVRAEALRFVVVPGHEDESLERVVGAIRDYLIIEKTGAGADVARETDPRDRP
jgi:hypothetical protein